MFMEKENNLPVKSDNGIEKWLKSEEYLANADLRTLKSTLETERYSSFVIHYGENQAKKLISLLVRHLAGKIHYKRTESKEGFFDWAVKTFRLDKEQQNIVHQTNITNIANDFRTIITHTSSTNYHTEYKPIQKITNSDYHFQVSKPKKIKITKNYKKMKRKKRNQGERNYFPNLKYTSDIIVKFFEIKGETKKSDQDCYDDLINFYKGKKEIKWGSCQSFKKCITNRRKKNKKVNLPFK